MKNTSNVTVVIGAGSIGQAIARRVSASQSGHRLPPLKHPMKSVQSRHY